MENQLIIGLMGKKRTGKSTLVNTLLGIAREPIAQIKSSDVINGFLSRLGIDPDRENQQKFALTVNEAFGEGRITYAVEQKIKEATNRIVIFDGVRLPTDVAMINRFRHHAFVFITASAEARYARAIADSSTSGPHLESLETFIANDQVSTETHIEDLARQAGAFHIDNSGTLLDLRRQVAQLYRHLPILG